MATSTLIISADYTTLELQGLISEGNTTESIVTSAPVEDGFEVSDGVVRKPKILNLEAIAQDFTHSKEFEGYNGRAEAILQQLRDWQELGTKVNVEAGGINFVDHIITSIGYVRTNGSNSLRLNISLQEIRTVKTEWVAGKRQIKPKRTADASSKKADKVEPDKKTDVKVSRETLARILLSEMFKGQ